MSITKKQVTIFNLTLETKQKVTIVKFNLKNKSKNQYFTNFHIDIHNEKKLKKSRFCDVFKVLIRKLYEVYEQNYEHKKTIPKKTFCEKIMSFYSFQKIIDKDEESHYDIHFIIVDETKKIIPKCKTIEPKNLKK